MTTIIIVIVLVIVLLTIIFFWLLLTSLVKSKRAGISNKEYGHSRIHHRKLHSQLDKLKNINLDELVKPDMCICENNIKVVVFTKGKVCEEVDSNIASVIIEAPFPDGGGYLEAITTHEVDDIDSIGDKYRAITFDNESNNYYTFVSMNNGANTINIYHSNGVIYKTLPVYDANKDRLLLTKYNQDGLVQWCTEIRGTLINPNVMQESTSSSVSVDERTGDVYVSGRINSVLNNPAIFLNSNGSIGIPMPGISGDSVNPFLAKYTKDGNIIWLTRIVTSLPGSFVDSKVNSLTGNIFLQFSYGATTASAYNSDGTLADIFPAQTATASWAMIKYNSNGKRIWRAYSESTDPNTGGRYSLDIHKETECVYVTSADDIIANSNFTIMDGTNSSFLAPNQLSTQIWKLSRSGQLQWIAPTSLEMEDGGWNAIAVDQKNGDIVVTGQFGAVSEPTIQIRNQNNTIGQTINPDSHRYVGVMAKYSSNGVVKWTTLAQSNIVTGTSRVYPISVAINSLSGDIYALYGELGQTNPTSLFNSDGSLGLTETTLPNEAALVKYNSDGFTQWSVKSGPREFNNILLLEKSVAVNNCGSVYFANPTPNPDTTNAFTDIDDVMIDFPIAQIGVNSTFHSIKVSTLDSYILKVIGNLNNCHRRYSANRDVIICFDDEFIKYRRVLIKQGGYLELFGTDIKDKHLTNYL